MIVIVIYDSYLLSEKAYALSAFAFKKTDRFKGEDVEDSGFTAHVHKSFKSILTKDGCSDVVLDENVYALTRIISQAIYTGE